MTTIAFISGKGGTGKTSFVASFARIAAPVVVADCDVDAANTALLLPGEVLRTERFLSGQRAVIDSERCMGCGICVDGCRFDAIREEGDHFSVDHLACEGCKICQLLCGPEAVHMVPNEAGFIRVLQSDVGPLVSAELYPAQSNSGKLVSRVRELARNISDECDLGLELLDGPPGIGCPVHATLARADLVVVITEPTPSGEHDMERAITLLEHFKLPGCVIINKADLDVEVADRLTALAGERGLTVVGKLPFMLEAPRSLARGKALIDIDALRPLLEQMWQEILLRGRRETEHEPGRQEQPELR